MGVPGKQLITAARQRGLRSALRERYPRTAHRYKRSVRRHVARGHPFAVLDAWVSRGRALRAEHGALAITIDRDGAWLSDARGLQYAYVEGPQTMLGLKTGEDFEQAEVALLTAALPPGGVVIDVGANIGRVAMAVATEVADSRVIAIEPVQSTHAVLAANVARNGLRSRVKTLRIALGAQPGRGAVTSDRGSANYLVRGGPGSGTEPVEIATLDEVVQQEGLDRVDVVKCDVEGAELAVLEGATRTLQALRPALLLEVEERWMTRYGRRASELFELLLASGYHYQRIRAGAVEPAGRALAEDLAASKNFWFTTD